MATKFKYLSSIRLDESDTKVFERAATPGEPLVSGAFLFQGLELEGLKGPRLQAFQNGFLGVYSLGWCTLAAISETEQADIEVQMTTALAESLVREFGAPDIASVTDTVREEVTHSLSLCDQAVNTWLAVQRTFQDDGINENVHIVSRDASGHDDFKIWEWVEKETKNS